ncbi:MAG: sulfurtransferase TusA family protein [Candidatus Omnitrophica bacterium]|nr:sulfurtransferase TusA family protein [Candidatus Omnitrophota bacterium]
MAVIKLDAVGLKCPQPVLKLAQKVPEMKPGDILEVTADCSTFEKDVRAWCDRTKRTMLSAKDIGGGKKVIQVQF